MIKRVFWIQIAENWALDDDGINIPDNFDQEAQKAKGITEEDLIILDDISNDEIDDILADLGLDDF